MAEPQKAAPVIGARVLVQYKPTAFTGGPIHLGMPANVNAPAGFSVDEQLRWVDAMKEPGPLLPGVNSLTREVWDAVKSHPTVRLWLKEGLLSELRSASTDKLPTDEGEAVSLVKNTVQDSLLKGWRETEKRPGVLDTIEAQLDLLKLEAKKKEG
jgi:hypothetical protein